MEIPNFSPRLGGRLDLVEKRQLLLRFHWIEMEVLEILASWSETMVYVPVRAGGGRQIWEQALHCDRLGWALRNLKHLGRVVKTQAPTDEFVRYCEQLHNISDVALRLVAMHRVLIPAIAAAERAYLDSTDPLGDANSVDAVQLCVHDHERQRLWAEQMLGTILRTPSEIRRAIEFEHEQRQALIAAGGVTAHGPSAYFLPYHGWPESDESVATRFEMSPAVGQWQSSGYTYTKGFARGMIHLSWDNRFRYAESPAELEERPPHGSVDGLIHWLHGLFHGECQTVDRMGWLIVDFPELPWEMRKDMAQQAWEEARHIQIVAQLIEGLGGRLGQYPFPPYWGHLRRDFHHPVAHMVMGNIMGEGSAAAQTNDALNYTADWGNDWLRRGLEHLSGDEVVHINFGKTWGRRLTRADQARWWEQGKIQALAAAQAMDEVKKGFGLASDLLRQTDRIEREFTALLRSADGGRTSEPPEIEEY